MREGDEAKLKNGVHEVTSVVDLWSRWRCSGYWNCGLLLLEETERQEEGTAGERDGGGDIENSQQGEGRGPKGTDVGVLGRQMKKCRGNAFWRLSAK